MARIGGERFDTILLLGHPALHKRGDRIPLLGRRAQPDVAIGVGGFASGPTLRTAAKFGIPTVLQEQNSYAGLTNKLLAKSATKICVAYEQMDKFFPSDKIVVTGNPVRNDIIDIASKRDEAKKFFNLDPDKKTIFCFGGSLGARTLNESILENMQELLAADVQLIWQIGSFYFEEFNNKLKAVDLKNIRHFEFLKEMDLAYAASDIVLSRAGALSISEICITGKPAIFVPSPNVSEDHQTKNAMALVEENAALMVKDTEARANLIPEALKLVYNDQLQNVLSTNIKKFARPNAAESIVREVVKIVS